MIAKDDRLAQTRNEWLQKWLNLTPEEYEPFLTRGLSLMQKVQPLQNSQTAFEYYYGVGTQARVYADVGTIFGVTGAAAREQVRKSKRILKALRAQIDDEREHPKDFKLWKTDSFFSLERAYTLATIDSALVKRIQQCLRNDCLETVEDVTKRSGYELKRIPNMGNKGVEAITSMLTSVDLALAVKNFYL